MAIRREPGRGKGEKERRLEALSQKELVADLEEKLERLRVEFEQYFLGIERRPPLGRKAEVQKIIRHLQTKRIGQTQLRFKFQGLVGRFNVFETYWTRIMRKIEEGTYERDLFKAKLKEQLGSPSGQGAARAQRQTGPNFGLSEDRLRSIFDQYVEARRHCGEAVDGLRYEKVREALLREAPRIAEKMHSQAVDFQVVVRGGRAVLKAVTDGD